MKFTLTFLFLAPIMIFPFEIHGHRGMRGEGVENTLPAFKAAVMKQVDVLECDVFLTKDHVPVIHHDPTVDKDVLIKSLTLNELKKIDPTLTTLEELMEEVKQTKVGLNIEIKRHPKHPEESFEPSKIAEEVTSLVERLGFEKRVYYTSFDPGVLAEIRKRESGARLGLLFGRESLQYIGNENALETIFQVGKSLELEMLLPEDQLVQDEQYVKSIQEAGFRVIVWTVNDPMRQRALVEMRVNGIITDEPGVLRQIIEKIPVL